MYFAINLSRDSDAQFHHPVCGSIVAAMDDADTRPEEDAKIMQVSGLRRIVASREVGQDWIKH